MTATVLDPCCGGRMMWFNRQDQRCLFGDMRHESIIVTDRTHRDDGTRAVHIHPDVRFDFRDLPFPDESFYHVVFDPPTLSEPVSAAGWRPNTGSWATTGATIWPKGLLNASGCFAPMEP